MPSIDEVDADPEVRAVVVTGRGRGFCAGADLGGGDTTFDTDSDVATGGGVVREEDGRHRDEGGLVALRFFELHEAGDRRDQRRGRRRGRHDDASLRRTARVERPRSSGSSSPVAASSPRRARRGSSRASSASAGRWSGAPPAGSSGPTRPSPADSCAPSTSPTTCSPRRTRSRPRSRRSASAVSVTLTRAMLWRMLGEPHPMGAHRIDSALVDALGPGADVREGVAQLPPEATARLPEPGAAGPPAGLPVVGGAGVLIARGPTRRVSGRPHAPAAPWSSSTGP